MSGLELWPIAGPNGAGKTSLARKALAGGLGAGLEFFNPDERTLRHLQAAGYAGFADAPEPVLRACFLAGAREVETALRAAIQGNRRIAVETVLSTDKYRKAVEEVKARGGHVFLLYVVLASPEISGRRVAARVLAGGHDVPPDRLIGRWHKSLARLGWFAAQAREFWVYDNSGEDVTVSPRLVAWGAGGRIIFQEGIHDYLQQALSGLPPSG